MPLLPLAEGLVKRGVKVFIAFRDLAKVSALYGNVGVNFLQAPIRINQRPFFYPDLTFTHILANVGFGDEGELFGLACAWRNLIGMVRPDLVIFDHSPTALLGSRGFPIRRAIVGFGFCTPPDVSPLPVINHTLAANIDSDRFLQEEQCILQRINDVLNIWKQPPLARVSQLYTDVEENFLTTFPEIDHFGPRPGATYWGPLSGAGGAIPQWPTAPGGMKIYAYLKPAPFAGAVLTALKELGHSTIVFSHELAPRVLTKYEAPNIRFENRRLDAKLVAAQSDGAVLNATHGTVIDFLLAGKPILQLPISVEQTLITHATLQTGAVLTPSPGSDFARAFKEGLNELLSNPSYRHKAEIFANKYATFNRNEQLDKILDRLYELTGASSN